MSDQDDGSVTKRKTGVRRRANEIKDYRCKNLIAVLENPSDFVNVGTVVRNVNALGVEKTYIVDERGALPDDWQYMREKRSLARASVSAVKWSFVKRFNSTADCLAHLAKQQVTSIATSPYLKGRRNVVLHEADYTAYAKLAVWFGTEGAGLSEEALDAAEMCVGLPMFGMVDSLNLGTSSGIVLYEVTKQRRAYQNAFAKRDRKLPRSAAAQAEREERERAVSIKAGR